tara:strand:- start:7640 stop:7912 length:273 start_codon:yes stop_codon:yes gene_type:complete
MEDFGLGFASFFLLIQITNLVVTLCLRFKDMILGIAGGMVGLDMVGMVVYGWALKPFTEDVKLFIGGMGLAIFCSLLYKVKAFLKMQEKL